MKPLKDWYRTGEFAKLCNVPKSILLYYDRIGLLNPARTEENGYRMYHVSQYAKLNAIRTLQSLHVPLEEIRRMYQEGDLAKNIGMLRKNLGVLNEAVQKLQAEAENLDSMAGHLERYLEYGPNRPFIERRRKTLLHTAPLPEGSFVAGYITHGYHSGLILREERVFDPAWERADRMFCLAGPGCPANEALPAGDYIGVYLHWTAPLRDRVEQFLRCTQGYQTTGDLYFEDTLNDFLEFSNQSDVLMATRRLAK